MITFVGFKAKNLTAKEDKMLDIHLNWMLVLVANFLCLIFILNVILYKPLLKIFEERKESVRGSLEAATQMNASKEEGLARLNREIADARSNAKGVFEGMRNDGLDVQRKFLADAEAQAAEMLQKARTELRTDVEKARQSLKADVDKFSDEIVRKLVNV